MSRVPALHARLIKTCLRRGRTLEEAEDLVQEGYLRLLQYRKTATVRDERTFLARIVANLTINLYHREQILSFAPEPFEELEEQALFADRNPGPERIVAARQRLDAIASLLGSVSQRTFQIFLAHKSGYTHQEISARLGISRRTVQKHIARAALLLKVLAETA